ncbi:translation initiation factor eIF-2B subunit delta-like isoform X1 [Chenopodium quinoa]|uniref:Translation initiation factor eIF2B subunit delta n=2 Tax=Chenopodium quinoa TaxID=63459 RepID=A0A803LKP6_CHEQI|nr:translation initiation factor eIF-2B subunit delta-like isoform X1 [Chenopodium quinoa]
MDPPPRRGARAVIDPKVRQVGFFAPDRTRSDSFSSSSSSSPVGEISPSGNSLSPVMIPPPRHSSDTHLLLSSSRPVGPHYPPVPSSPLRRPASDVANAHLVVGSYNPSESENSEDVMVSPSGGGKGRKGGSKFASSMPSGAGGGFDLMVGKAGRNGGVGVISGSLITASGVNLAAVASEKVGDASTDAQSEQHGNAKPSKEKMSKAERRALQEAQRAAKAAAKAEMGKASAAASGVGSSKQVKAAKASVQNKDNVSVAASEKKGVDRQSEKERKKDVPHPRMQFDDKTRVEKAKKRAVVNQTEARNRVELFRHLPQYEHGTQLPDLESKFFQLEPMHPAVYKVGLRYLTGDISGGNARCIAMLQAFQEAINDYSTPPEKALIRDLTARIGSYVSFLIECRPLSISMGNAIRFLKNRIAKLPMCLSESEAKASLQSDINHFISEKILIADKVIVKHAVTKIRDGDVLLTYGSSSAVEMILLHAHEMGKQFRVVIVDSRPKLEGQLLLRRLVAKGVNCTYTHINAVSYTMHEVTRVFLGAASVLSNGTVYSRVGTACVAMVAHAFHVPVLVCCEAYKFHERVQLDSICFNELGDPDAILKVPGRREINYLKDWTSNENLQLLNLMYDTTPSDYISMIITDYGMIPPTSVPVIVREYRREHLWG